MWITLTDLDGREVRVNSDNIIAYGPSPYGATVTIASGHIEVSQTPDEISTAIGP